MGPAFSTSLTAFAAGPPPAGTANAYHPVVSLSFEGEVRTDAMIRLKGDRSWTFALDDDHNFYIYDHPQVGFLWLSDDLDSAFARIGSMQPPIYWWAGRYWTPSVLPQHYLAVIGDPQGRAAFVAAIAEVFDRYDVAALQGWIDAWSAQIAPAVTRDAHLPFTAATHNGAVAAMRAEVAQRAAYLTDFLSCERGGGTDLDGDGYPWCNDCDDNRADVYPGAPERCGDGVDQNCDGVPDDGCPR